MKCSRCPKTETARWYGKTTDAPYCCSCYRKEYVVKNREKALAAQRKANSSETSRQARREYDKSEAGKESKRKSDKKKYWSNPDKAKTKNSKYRAETGYARKYYLENKPVYTEQAIRRRRHLDVASLNGLDRDKTIEVYANCPEGHEVDHIVPIKGKDFRNGERQQVVCGLHVYWNLQYLPKEENRKKSCNLYSLEDLP